MRQKKDFDMPKRRVRPTTRQSTERTQRGPKADQANSTTRYGREVWRSPYPLSRGMSAKEMAQTFGACLLAVIAGNDLLDLFAWYAGHFAKGWW